jgi:hypothetical protein
VSAEGPNVHEDGAVVALQAVNRHADVAHGGDRNDRLVGLDAGTP